MVGEQVVGVEFLFQNAPGEDLVLGPDRFAAFDKARQLRPYAGIDLFTVFNDFILDQA